MPEISRTRLFVSAALVCVMALVNGACSSDDDAGPAPTTREQSSDEPGPSVRQPALEGPLVIVAAESLDLALPEIIERFDELNSGVDVTVRYGSTPVLAMELADGASGDVFIAGDTDFMQSLVDSGRTDGPPRQIARESLAIVTSATGSADVTSLDSLSGKIVALCEAATPCGMRADAILEDAGVEPAQVVRRAKGDDAITAVVAGEADAAVVFKTRADTAGSDVDVIDLTGVTGIYTTHAVATLAPAVNALAARAFVDFLRSSESADVLESYGFQPI